MGHKHTICEEGYTIEQCRCPGPITAVLPCPGGDHVMHQHTRYRYEAKTGPAILIEGTVTPTPSIDIVRSELAAIYGSGDLITALAENIVKRWGEWEVDDRRDLPTNLQLYIWDWLAGGDTAQLAADRILIATGYDKA